VAPRQRVYAPTAPSEFRSRANQESRTGLAKSALIKEVHRALRHACSDESGVDPSGFARPRRHVPSARDLLFKDINRLKYIAESIGPIQILYGGKAHPHDAGGKAPDPARDPKPPTGLKNDIKILYLDNYTLALAKPHHFGRGPLV